MDVRVGLVLQGQAEQLDGAVGDGEVVAQRVGGGADDAQVEGRQLFQLRQRLVQLGFRPDEGGDDFVLVGRHALLASLGRRIGTDPGPLEPPPGT